jgi:hypothetical protein
LLIFIRFWHNGFIEWWAADILEVSMRKYRPAQMLLSIGPSWQMGTANVVLGKSNGAREGKVPSVGQIIVKGGKKKELPSRLYGISRVNEEAIVPGK